MKFFKFLVSGFVIGYVLLILGVHVFSILSTAQMDSGHKAPQTMKH